MAAALEGAFAQTYSPLDIVFIDDCSTDGGFEVAQRLIEQYRGPHRVVVARNECNVGLGTHDMRILALSPGEVLVFADADDISLPNRCQRICEAFRDGGPNLLGLISYFDTIDAEGRPITDLPPGFAADRARAEEWTAEMLAREIGGPSGAVAAFRRRVFEVGVPLDGLRQSDDTVCGFRCAVLGRLATVPEVLVLRRVHLDNMSGPTRPSWTGAQFAAWFARYMSERVLIPGFMRRDLDRFEKAGLIPTARAAALRREIAPFSRQLKLLRVAPRLSRWRAWFSFCTLRSLGIPPRRSLRLTLQVAAPSLAMAFLRRNALFRKRARMERR